MIDVPFFKLFFGGLKQRGIQDLARQAINVTGIKYAIDTGDLEAGILPMSQAIGLIKDLPTCQELIERTVSEARELVEGLREKFNS
jgi:NAD(P)H-dependent flavin oxidoreductase YrpB (nitropropane dioxygenase family)